ncbi:uncharacterized protein LOC128244099 [Mya arenaria]|uniref:uncharacterized protein LOC128244099 n=1 Tax=Mya arenaria TaxID=6604 RepID=UPI0022E371B6|nr:uncharacterized protein LOC128244099 [Mya arenaria]
MIDATHNLEISQQPRQRASSFKRNTELFLDDFHDFRPRAATAPTRNNLRKPHLHHTHRHHEAFDPGEFYTVRHFEMSSKGVILKKSDSMHSRSTNSVVSSEGEAIQLSHSSHASSSSQGSIGADQNGTEVARILVLGTSTAGKTALLQQFQTSEYLGGFDTSTGK